MKFSFIKENHTPDISVRKICEMLEVSESGYYKWLRKKSSKREKEEKEVLAEIEAIFFEHKKRYGSPRIAEVLQDRGYTIGENRVARIMKKYGISATFKKKYKIQTTDSAHSFQISPNILKQNFNFDKLNTAWASDITYLPFTGGFLYLCVIIDLCNRETIGWSVANHMRTEMATEALEKAVQVQNPGPGLIFHSDRGSQYASDEFRTLLEKYQMRQSMSRKGNCYDNAVVESFFHTIKNEEIREKNYQSLVDARINLFDYTEVYYNRNRKHSYLNYISPM